MSEWIIMKQETEIDRSGGDQNLCSLLEEKLALFNHIAEASWVLKAALASGNIPQIAGAIAQRQEYMDSVDKTDEKIMVLMVHGKSDRQTETGARSNSLVSTINGLLQTLIPLNQACEGSASQILGQYRDELQQIQDTKRACHAYVPRKHSPARFLDVAM